MPITGYRGDGSMECDYCSSNAEHREDCENCINQVFLCSNCHGEHTLCIDCIPVILPFN